ncbi:FAD-dependent oxidoreductase [Plantactinospora mayteni]|uniref:Oxidoreductase n=1 Tax=Plantactinospora mayteni TaxID=566021 RepID=A0ABQ4EVF3_9ACTN|nr:FAD-dependent oxidoreductase [Plantactinospora mayteni]GIG98626.1 oxidoreductase [Plantactinospora mayteni]
MAPNPNGPRIVVLGGGYTGTMAAIRLARRTRRSGGRVTLVNPSTRFTERLRMHQIGTGQRLVDHQIPDLLRGTGVEFRPGRATAIDRERRKVRLATADGDRGIGYDILVYALGSVADHVTVPGADAHAYTLDSPATAARLAARLSELDGRGGGTVAVCGAGLTGIEAAAEIAENRPGLRVVLLTRATPGAMMGDRARARLHRSLDRLGIEVRTEVEVVRVLPDAVELADGELVPVDACLWTTGFVAPPLAAEAGLTVDPRGRIVVDPTLRALSDPAVYAVGDAAAIQAPWGTLHGTCQSGIPSAAHAADTIARRLRGRDGRPFRFGYLHQPVSLGRRDAVIQFTHPDDTPNRWYLAGRWAALYKEVVTSSPTPTYRLSRWLTVPLRAISRNGSVRGGTSRATTGSTGLGRAGGDGLSRSA